MKIYQDATKSVLRLGRFYSVANIINAIIIMIIGTIAAAMDVFVVGFAIESITDDHRMLCSESSAIFIIIAMVCNLIFTFSVFLYFTIFKDMYYHDYTADAVAIFYHKEKHTLSIFSAAGTLLLPKKYIGLIVSSAYSEQHSIKHEHKGKYTCRVDFNLSFNIVPEMLTDLGRDLLRQSIEDDDIYDAVNEHFVNEWFAKESIFEFDENNNLIEKIVNTDALSRNPFGFRNVEISKIEVSHLT